VSRILIDKDGNPVHLQVVRPAEPVASPAPPRPESGPAPPVPRGARARVLVVQTPHGSFRGPADDPATRRLLESGDAAGNEVAMLLSFVAQGETVLDVGSHIGTFAVPAARKVGGSGRVFSFEPAAATHACLVANVRENGVEGAVHAEQLGASDRRETLHVPREAGDGTIETVSLDGWWRSVGAGPGRRIAMFRIHAGGMDCRVLKGARRILERDRPVLHFEFDPDALVRAGSSVRELEQLLSDHHYHCFANLGPSGSAPDGFRLGRIRRPRDLGEAGHVLAFHRASLRYPAYFAGPAVSRWVLRTRGAAELPGRALRRLARALGSA
jgi:FkbM family methyltransferase